MAKTAESTRYWVTKKVNVKLTFQNSHLIFVCCQFLSVLSKPLGLVIIRGCQWYILEVDRMRQPHCAH